MSGGNLYVARYLSCYDDGSAVINLSGGTANVDGLSFAGRAGRDYELNISGTADVVACPSSSGLSPLANRSD
ncbi:MAG: hypothetical protein ACYTBJ_18025 [Planctomycetota bacterium]|jgi:hypothetical protein